VNIKQARIDRWFLCQDFSVMFVLKVEGFKLQVAIYFIYCPIYSQTSLIKTIMWTINNWQ